ncbi:MAG TPA: ABC transporter permease [Actinomycetota bacterium]|jgi:peptide/nickel transport system permease protein|nr:ABC transporter permease [Actinomycetota bacterium]
MADTRPRPPATEPTVDQTGNGQELQTTAHGVQVHEVPQTTTEREFTVVRRSQTQMVIRRFMAHKLAVGSLVVFVLVVLASLVGGRFWKYGYADITDQFSTPPSLEHPMGTDDIGHDTLAQVLRGAQKSVQVALMVAFLATTIGAVIGAVAGYYRGWVDAALMRFTDLILTIPSIAILAVLASVVAEEAGNWFFIGLVLALLQWTYIARVVRGTFLSLREKEFVEAARALGASDARIMFRHLLPNATGSIIVNATVTVAVAILIETALSYLGLGIKPPDTSLGLLISTGQQAATTRPWLFYFPGLIIIIIALTINFVGDGLRDAFDPTQTRVRA